MIKPRAAGFIITVDRGAVHRPSVSTFKKDQPVVVNHPVAAIIKYLCHGRLTLSRLPRENPSPAVRDDAGTVNHHASLFSDQVIEYEPVEGIWQWIDGERSRISLRPVKPE